MGLVTRHWNTLRSVSGSQWEKTRVPFCEKVTRPSEVCCDERWSHVTRGYGTLSGTSQGRTRDSVSTTDLRWMPVFKGEFKSEWERERERERWLIPTYSSASLWFSVRALPNCPCTPHTDIIPYDNSIIWLVATGHPYTDSYDIVCNWYWVWPAIGRLGLLHLTHEMPAVVWLNCFTSSEIWSPKR